MDILHYMLKMNLCWIIFYVVYQVLFRKHTFFAGNRFYLLASLFAGACIPGVELHEKGEPLLLQSQIGGAGLPMASHGLQSTSMGWELIILTVYLAGVLGMLFLLLKALTQIYLIVRSGTSLPMDGCKLIINHSGKAGGGSFSFFQWMVMSVEDYEAHFEYIFAHERVHIKQLHSLDILLVELLKVVFWFNPVLWLYKLSLQQVHEFLADECAPDKDRYATFMLSYARRAMSASVTSKFFDKSLLKRRIYMIYKQRTPKWMGWKYASVFPLLIVTVMLMATRKYDDSNPKVKREPGIRPGMQVGNLTARAPGEGKSEERQHKKRQTGTSRSFTGGPDITSVTQHDGVDSLSELRALVSQMSIAVASNDLKNADSLKSKINPIIWAESARLRKEQTLAGMRSQGLAALPVDQDSSNVLGRMRKAVVQSTHENYRAQRDGFDLIRRQFEEIVSNLRGRMNSAAAESEKNTQDQIIHDLIAAGAASDKANLSYRLHNMFLIVNGVEQPEALHQKLKDKYLRYGWMEWVYNWEGSTGYRFTGVRFNG